MKINIDPQEDIIKFMNIDATELKPHVKNALMNFGVIYKDTAPAKEDLLCPYKTEDILKSLKPVSKIHKVFVSEAKKQIKTIIKLCEKHDCSYVRIINYYE